MNSVDGRYNPFVNTVDGMSSLDLDYLTVSGQSVDIENIVPYTGANKAINLNFQRVFTSYNATAITDLCNKNYVDNTIFNATNGLGTFVANNFLQLNTSATQNISSLVNFSTSIYTPIASIGLISSTRATTGTNYGNGPYSGYHFDDICNIFKYGGYDSRIERGSNALNLVRTDGGYNNGDYGAGLTFSQLWFNGGSYAIKTGAITGHKQRDNGVYGGGLCFHVAQPGQLNLLPFVVMTCDKRLGINNLNPQFTLDVAGNAYISGDTILTHVQSSYTPTTANDLINLIYLTHSTDVLL